jgi:hypothetical protein
MRQVWSVKINGLFEEPNLGVLLGTVTLLLGIVSRNYQGYEAAVPKARAVHDVHAAVQLQCLSSIPPPLRDPDVAAADYKAPAVAHGTEADLA